MIQRIQTVYLLLAAVAMVVCAAFSAGSLPVCIPAVVAAGLSCYTIFLYKKRPLQASVCRLLCLFGAAFAIYLTVAATGGYAQKDFLLPMATDAVAILCWLLASIAIVKDEKLVRSLDRIR